MEQLLNVLGGSEMALEDFYTELQKSAQQMTLIQIDYESPRDGKFTTMRQCEPYKYDGTFLWAFDIAAGHIKKFYASGITNLISTDTPFTPRWPIEIT